MHLDGDEAIIGVITFNQGHWHRVKKKARPVNCIYTQYCIISYIHIERESWLKQCRIKLMISWWRWPFRLLLFFSLFLIHDIFFYIALRSFYNTECIIYIASSFVASILCIFRNSIDGTDVTARRDPRLVPNVTSARWTHFMGKLLYTIQHIYWWTER